MVEVPLPELLAKGEAQLAKDHAAFVETAQKIDASKTPPQGMAQLSAKHPDPRMRLAQLSEALLRDCRYVVGVQLHTAGWTVEQGAKLFHEQCFQEQANAYEEARRGAYNPTYLYYTLGKLQIQELASEYMEKKHATLKQFHDAFVSQGALPVPMVRRILLR